MTKLRILVTHDFFGCFAPLKTTRGLLGGGARLRSMIDEMRGQGPTVWIDTGDLVQGGPLTLPTRGKGGIIAASELGVDVSIAGNHELDFGIPFFLESLETFPFPVLGANAGLSLDATTIIATPVGDVGVVGLTHHDLASMRSWSMTPDREMPCQSQLDRAIDVVALANELRRQGAAIVVAALHDGVDWHFDIDRRWNVFPERLVRICSQWAGAVDAILCGHTLGRFSGTIAGTPVIQPWPLGCEIGIVEIGYDCQTQSSFQLVESQGPLPWKWSGYGADIIDTAEGNVLGYLAEPLYSEANGQSSLACFLAHAISEISDADAAVVYSTYSQPVIDGRFAFLEHGYVTELDILQLVPYSDFGIVETEINDREWIRISELFGPRPQSRSTIWSAVKKRQRNNGVFTLATIGGAATAVLSGIIGRDLLWQRRGPCLLDGLTAVLHAPARYLP
ncbi:metallophosphoesterase [Mesorhizobium sp. M1005]|uniref:metallophosphoesterase n=1 Tax=unclassified Mesorhizobium TaxID=325217 RepID=UPI00333CC3DE